MNNIKANILCVGSAGRDIFFPTDAGRVFPSPIPEIDGDEWSFGYGEKIHVDDRFQAPGGCACNVSVGIARLGGETTAYGIIGSDADGTWIKEELLREGVDVENLRVHDDASSDLSMILVHAKKGERIIFANRDVGECLVLEKREVAWYPWVFVGSLYGDAIIDNMKAIHDAVHTKKTRLIYNPGMSNIMSQSRNVLDLLHHSTLIFVNKKEAQAIVSHGDTVYNKEELDKEEQLVRILAEHTDNRAVIVLTYGEHGAWVYDDNRVRHITTQDQDIVDTTGAGDAFASGFVAAYTQEKEIELCMRWGAANSHSVIAHYGAHEGLLQKKQIEESCQTFIISNIE